MSKTRIRGELRRPHHVDLKTGMYKGRQIFTPKAKGRRVVADPNPLPSERAVPYRSSVMATPMPPPMHKVARPFLAPRRFISCSSVTSTRAPDAPIG